MLTAHRAAESHRQREDLLDDISHGAHGFSALQIEHRADMQTTTRCVGINPTIRPMRIEDALHLTHKNTQPFHGNGAVFDKCNRARRLRTRIHNTQTDFADIPNARLIFGRFCDRQQIAQTTNRFLQRRRLVAAKFHYQHCSRIPHHPAHLPCIRRDTTRIPQNQLRNQLHGAGLHPQQTRNIITGFGDAGI